MLSCTKCAGRPRLGGSVRATTRGREPLSESCGDAFDIPPPLPMPRLCALVGGGGTTGKARVTLASADCNWARIISSSSYLISEHQGRVAWIEGAL